MPVSDIQLFNGDCLEVLKTLPDGSVDAVVTDPPFSSGTRREGSKGLRKSMNRSTGASDWFASDCLTTNGFLWLMRSVARECRRLVRPGGHILSFIDWRMMPALAGAMESADLRHLGLLVWDKTYFGMGRYFRNQHELIVHFSNGKTREASRRDVGNVLRAKPIRNGDHDTEKPVDLLETLISVVTVPGERVMDPFSGSGTTGEAAVKTGRKFIGVELDKTYFKIGSDRIAAAQAARAELLIPA